eukprot:NODE_1666_length_1645_cov_188.341656_g1587_i0.p1 GENE.NODE_1666_length_1645_cov_188.341656_g1587_i0~~NODE_1666_length_1645_cov_188.341656_g1587_i0.p1  ORF type:complete len:432 (+),score=70.29 NODE_1666_length_1645_cov_188.341656_g1587_i0:63-1358(+)
MSFQARRVVVTGISMISPFGVGVGRAFDRLLNGSTGIKRHEFVPGFDMKIDEVVGLIPRGLGPGELDPGLLTTHLKKMGLNDIYGMLATQHALVDSGWDPSSPEESRMSGSIMASSTGNLTEAMQLTKLINEKGDLQGLPKYTLPEMTVPAIHAALDYKLHGPMFGIGAACAGGTHAIVVASTLIKSGMANVMLAGATDACVNPLTVGSFKAAGIQAPEAENGFPVKPFDVHRCGTALAEGSASFVLEEYEHAKRRGAKIYCELEGCSIYSDGAGILHADEPGQTAAMTNALKNAEMDPSTVGMLIAHATGTRKGDVAEARAVSNVFGAKGPIVYASKGATGHSLAAASAWAAAIGIMSINTGRVPPVAGNTEHDPKCPVRLSNAHPELGAGPESSTVLIHGLGMGGHDSCCIFSRRKLDAEGIPTAFPSE